MAAMWVARRAAWSEQSSAATTAVDSAERSVGQWGGTKAARTAALMDDWMVANLADSTAGHSVGLWEHCWAASKADDLAAQTAVQKVAKRAG